MTPPRELAFRSVQAGLIRAASLLAPVTARTEWLQEWQSELWHVRQATVVTSTKPWRAEQEVIRFCIGAFEDALCLRQLARRNQPLIRAFRGSATQCILSLAAILTASYILSLLLPGVSAESHPSRYQISPGVILIQHASSSDDSIPTISAEQFRIWNGRRQRYFDRFAFYRIAQDTVSAAVDNRTSWRVAHASPNLFSLLGLDVHFRWQEERVDKEMPAVVLSEKAWKTDFGANLGVIGTVIRVGDREARVAGVLQYGTWRLPGSADAWLLEPDIENTGVGFVVAQLTALGKSEMLGERVPITAYDSDDSDGDFWGETFGERTRGPQSLYVFTIFLAFLALPAVTSVSLREYSFCTHRISWTRKFFRWSFLAAKVLLLLPIAYFCSLDLAYWHAANYSVASEYLQLISSFSICLFGMRWVLLDQRQRCPVCLKKVTHPAQVGQLSRTFLAWNGTELICTSGHTLLHIPALPTSWFDTQRWLYLDNSWEFLFANPSVG